ncbi:hypothetical protein CDEF62S_01825 [Castellaniella defragrans]
MFSPLDMITLVSVLIFLVFCGFHIAIALGSTSMLGIYMINGNFSTVMNFSSITAFSAIQNYVFAVIPLFMLMGEFLAKCGRPETCSPSSTGSPNGCRGVWAWRRYWPMRSSPS